MVAVAVAADIDDDAAGSVLHVPRNQDKIPDHLVDNMSAYAFVAVQVAAAARCSTLDDDCIC